MKKLLNCWYFLPAFMALSALFPACNKDIEELSKQPVSDAITSIRDVADLKVQLESRSEELTSEQQEQLQRLRQAASIIFELVKNSEARAEIMDGVRSAFYEDESIAFKDLFNSTQSPAFDHQSRQVINNGFQSKLSNGDYMNSSEYGVTPSNPGGDGFDLKSYLECNKIQVYWPYSENWDGQSSVTPTISYHPIEQEDVNIGWKLVPVIGDYTYEEVVVDDTFAQGNPVWVINFYEGDKIDDNCEYVTEPSDPGEPVDPRSGGCEEFPQDRVEVDVQKIKFFKQYDGIFGGGPEFRWVRGNIILNADGTQVTGVVPAFSKANLRRRDKYDWKTTSQPIWDTNWEVETDDQFVGLYEEDGGNQTHTVTIGGTIKIKLFGQEESTTIGYSGQFKSKDEVIYNVQYDRCWYFETSDDNTPFENYQGWNVRGVTGEVKWTMPYIEW
ncbi:MAG: hypothetical protein EPO28_10100 [Saprospiraceae bacterium]|nr:MAG: hypothetical protein EPO28_10100 [Saprospiraceae bacterium]